MNGGRYILRTSDGVEEEVEVAAWEDIYSVADEWCSEGYRDGVEATARVMVYVVDPASRRVVGSTMVEVDPEAPPCAEGHEHDWRQPSRLLAGGGVECADGGMRMRAVCPHCAAVRHRRTGVQDGYGRYTETRYEPRDAYVEEYYAERGRTAADALSDDEVRAHDESWSREEGAITVAAFRERLEERRAELAEEEER